SLYSFRRHLFAVALGTAACIVASRLPSETYRRLAYPLLATSVVALVLVLVPGIGLVRGGARRWLHVGPLSLQPSEAAKVALVLYLARSLSKQAQRVADFMVGLGESRQKMFYLPEAHTDFIFSVVGEELGLAGALVVLGLFGVIAARGLRTALRHPDPFASLAAFGVTVSLVLQALVNAGVVL